MKKRKVWPYLIITALIIMPLVAGRAVRHQLEKRLDIKISGRVYPSFLVPSFRINQASFEWKGKIRVISGDLKVSYDPSFFLKNSLRVRFWGSNVKAKLLGDWAKSQGVEDVQLDHLDADVGFGPEGLREIFFVSAESPKFQFHIKKSEI